MPSTSTPPFEVHMSQDAELFLFNDSWDHTRHYCALFNAQFELLKPWQESGKRWAMIADWRTLLIQVPDSERMCVRSLKEFSQGGLSYYAPVSAEMALAKWQAEQVAKQVPALPIKIFQDFDASIAHLKEQGFDTDFKSIPFNQEWLRPSEDFSRRVDELGVEKSKFYTCDSPC